MVTVTVTVAVNLFNAYHHGCTGLGLGLGLESG